MQVYFFIIIEKVVYICHRYINLLYLHVYYLYSSLLDLVYIPVSFRSVPNVPLTCFEKKQRKSKNTDRFFLPLSLMFIFPSDFTLCLHIINAVAILVNLQSVNKFVNS